MGCWSCVFGVVLVDLVVILLGFGCLVGKLCGLIVLVIVSCVYCMVWFVFFLHMLVMFSAC